MKSIPSTLILCGSLLLTAVAQAAPQMRDAATGDDLALKFRKASLNNPIQKMRQKPLTGPDPTTVNQPKDLIASSDFLSFRGLTTLVPKRAILHAPKNYRDRLKHVPGSKIVVWSDFFAVNRGWIKTVEVTRAQAQGREPFDEKIAERIQKSSILVVATFRGGPVSVLPLKEPEPEKEKS